MSAKDKYVAIIMQEFANGYIDTPSCSFLALTVDGAKKLLEMQEESKKSNYIIAQSTEYIEGVRQGFCFEASKKLLKYCSIDEATLITDARIINQALKESDNPDFYCQIMFDGPDKEFLTFVSEVNPDNNQYISLITNTDANVLKAIIDPDENEFPQP